MLDTHALCVNVCNNRDPAVRRKEGQEGNGRGHGSFLASLVMSPKTKWIFRLAWRRQLLELQNSFSRPFISFREGRNFTLLLESHQASQQTNFGRAHDQPGFPAPKARVVSLLFRFGRTAMEEKVPFRVESHVFAGEELESK